MEKKNLASRQIQNRANQNCVTDEEKRKKKKIKKTHTSGAV
jgi:hypothetical protein